jgi:hypothetical protein
MWSSFGTNGTAGQSPSGNSANSANSAALHNHFVPRQMPHTPWYFPAPGYPPNEPFYWAGSAHLPRDQYMPSSPYWHCGGGWFRPNLTFDPVATGFAPPPPPTVYTTATLTGANEAPGMNMIMHEDPTACDAGEKRARQDATMSNPAVARAALEAPSKKKGRKANKKRKSVRRSDGRVNLSIAQASKEMQT